MALSPAALMRQANTNKIAQFLRGQVGVNRTMRPNPLPTNDGSGGLRFDDAGLYGGPATLPGGPGPADFPVEPAPIVPIEGPTPGGGGQMPGGGQSTFGGNGWGPGMGLPGGPITGFGYNPPSGNAPPTLVPTFWGPGLGNTPFGVAAAPGDRGVPFAGLNLRPPEGHGTNRYVF